MKQLFLVAALCIPYSALAQTPPPFGPPSDGKAPSPGATRQVEARRKHLEAIGLWFARPASPLKDTDVRKALAELGDALRSKDLHVFEEAVRDVTNRHYVSLPADEILKLLLPLLKSPETQMQRMTAQGFVMEYLARTYGAKAKDAVPDLLHIVTDPKAPTYVRGQAVEAVARIAPGDPAVVKAFIRAATDPVPQAASAVAGRIAEKLGDMGTAAWPAKDALRRIFDLDPWLQDGAFIALGKLAMDDPPRPLADYLARLGQLDDLPLEQAAAAFLHVQKRCRPDAAPRPPHFAAPLPAQIDVPRELLKLDRKSAAAARPVLLKTLEDRPGDDVHVRAALRTLAVIGPGASARAARDLAGVLTRQPLAKTHEARSEARAALALLEPTDDDAVPALASGLEKVLGEKPRDWLSAQALAQVLTRYGKSARPAAPLLIRALEGFRTPPPYPAYDELYAHAGALAAIGDVPGARAVLLHLLDRGAPLLARAGDRAPEVEAVLLLAVGRLGLPPAGDERAALLDRVRGGLGGVRAAPFAAAANVVIDNGGGWTEKEAMTLVPLLVRVLAKDSHFKDSGPWTGQLAPGFAKSETRLPADGLAARALGAMGPAARDALPELERLASEPLVDVRGTYVPEPAHNFAIHEARQAIGKLRGDRP